MLHLGRLRLLHELSVLGTISAVAEAVHLTRPAVSQQLDQLEKELNLTLFQREGRHIRLTPVARHLVRRSEDLFQVVNDIEGELAATQNEVTGELRMAAFGSILIGLLPDIAQYLNGQYPHLRLSLRELTAAEGLKAAASNQVDIAVAHDMDAIEPYLPAVDVVQYCTDYLYLVASSKHRLADRNEVKLEELRNERWIFNLFSVGYHRELSKSFALAGYDPDILYNCHDMLVTLEFVRRNTAVTILPGLSLRSVRHDPDYSFIAIEPRLARKVFVAVQKGSLKKPSIQAVLDALVRRIPADLSDWYLSPSVDG